MKIGELREIRNENRRIVKKLDSQNSTIISISEELKSFRKEMSIYAKKERQIDSILETVKSLGDNHQMINQMYDHLKLRKLKSVFEENHKSAFQNEINSEDFCLTALAENKEDLASNQNEDFNENDNINLTDTFINREHLLYNSMSDEIPIKIEIENRIEENNEKVSNDQESNLTLDEEENFMNCLLNESASASQLNELEGSCIENVNKAHYPSDLYENNFDQKRVFKCDLCIKTFTQSANLKRHLRTHTGEKLFECGQCSKEFTQSSHLIRHLLIHTGERPFECDKCLKKFTRSSHLKRHLGTHSKKKCSKRLKQSSGLSRHLKETQSKKIATK